MQTSQIYPSPGRWPKSRQITAVCLVLLPAKTLPDSDYFFGVLNLRYRRVAMTDDAAPMNIPSASCIVNKIQ